MTRARLVRIVGVTGLLAGLGGVIGALGGAAVLLAWDVFADVLPGGGSAFAFFGAAAAVGAVYGVVLGTSLSWLLLRRVPLWRAIGEPAIAASLATTIAIALQAGPLFWLAPSAAALAAALRLRHATRTPSVLPPAASPPQTT